MFVISSASKLSLWNFMEMMNMTSSVDHTGNNCLQVDSMRLKYVTLSSGLTNGNICGYL